MKIFISILVTVVVMVSLFFLTANYKPEWILKAVFDKNGFPRNAKDGDKFVKGGLIYVYQNGVWIKLNITPPVNLDFGRCGEAGFCFDGIKWRCCDSTK